MLRLMLLVASLTCLLSFEAHQVLATSVQQNDERERIVAIMRNSGSIVVIDSEQEDVQEIPLPVSENYQTRDVAISHNGVFVVYSSRNSTTRAIQIRVFNRLTGAVQIEYDIQGDDAFIYLRASNFSTDDSKLAVGYYDSVLGSWKIVVFDLESGELIRTMTDGDFPNTYIHHGQYPFIYHFANDTITFINTTPFDSPGDFENASYDTLDWDFTTDTFSPNCVYTHLDQITYNPTGEVIETAIQRDLVETGDADVPTYGAYVLQLAEGNTRQVFFQNVTPLDSAQFVQNGERIVTWARSTENPSAYHMILIERDGTVIDELDVIGHPQVRSTHDRFVYRLYQDTTGWVIDFVYVNTRESAPFANRTILWQSDHDRYYYSLEWADEGIDDDLPDHMSWGDVMSYTINCPRSHG
ncbi:MAG: hypothetical protein RLP44_12610 [Aggregatilineales bacterium]